MMALIKVCFLSLVLFLTGCTGLFESKTCGIRNSKWQQLSSSEQYDIEKSYHEKQRLADQLRMNKLLAKQQKDTAKARKKNEKKQQARLADERHMLEKQSRKIEKDLYNKEQDYIHP